ncbi:MAG: amidophosphoribosyltransferase [Calditrichaeota bacterium]|nr:amidophosphoribosyltransferase [Calditrichota bacterium]
MSFQYIILNQDLSIKSDHSKSLSDAARPNCAVIGIWGLSEAANLSYLGLYAMQHRGQEAAGIVSSDGQTLYRHADSGLVADVFRDRCVFDNLPGNAALGHNRYSTTGSSSTPNVQPLLVEDRAGPIALAHNGNLVNYSDLRRFLVEEGSLFRTSTDSELFLHLFARSRAKSLINRLIEALHIVKGAYSLIILTRDSLIAVRDPLAFRPLSLGAKDDGWVVASETCAFDLLGAKYVRDVQPGEMVVFNDNRLESHQFAESKRTAHCIFEYIYFSRPDSRIFGVMVDKTRRRLGHILAERHPNPPDADFVIAVPDSSNTAGLGYAHQSGLPFEIALIRNHYIGRTFIEPEQRMRDFGAKVKFNPVAGVLRGRRVVLVDDSIVRGTTLRKLVRLIRGAGAEKVYVRISSPPIKNPCFYGMDFPTREELAADQHSIDEIRAYIEADDLEYLTPEELLEAVPHSSGQDYCTACFTGIYPVAVNNE